MKHSLKRIALLLASLAAINVANHQTSSGRAAVAPIPAQITPLLRQNCAKCHDKDTRSGGIDLTALSFDLADRAIREQWIRIYDRVEKGEMTPKAADLPDSKRPELGKR